MKLRVLQLAIVLVVCLGAIPARAQFLGDPDPSGTAPLTVYQDNVLTAIRDSYPNAFWWAVRHTGLERAKKGASGARPYITSRGTRFYRPKSLSEWNQNDFNDFLRAFEHYQRNIGKAQLEALAYETFLRFLVQDSGGGED
jgi:hypothetical protein